VFSEGGVSQSAFKILNCVSHTDNASLNYPPRHSVTPARYRLSARCAYTANVAVGKDLDIFALGAVSLTYIYAPNCK
jgi:hypothetical protein